MARPPVNVPGKNRLLEILGDEGKRLARRMDRIEAPRGHVLSRRHAPLSHVQFPLEGMVSMVLGAVDGASVEIGTLGNEGMVGTPLYLGAERAAAETFFQTSGSYLQMSAAHFRESLARSPAFSRLVGRYTQAMIEQMAQSVMCSALHSLEERLCRWLLMTHDRLEGDELDLTQEFIAQM